MSGLRTTPGPTTPAPGSGGCSAGPARRPRPSRAAFVSLAVVLCVGSQARAAEPAPARPLDGPGPHEVVTLEVEVPRTGSPPRSFAAVVFVPVPLADGDSAVATPAVAFGHGYLADVDWYESTLSHLASWGIAVIAPRSASQLFPDHQAFADDLRSSLDWALDASADPETWPGAPVDPAALAVAGHSMGGGAALLAAARDPSISAVATLAAAETEPSAIEAAGAITAPVLFLAASDDTITPVERHQRPMFEAKGTGPAQLRTIEGGSHCGFLDLESVILGLVCDEAAIGAEAQRRITREVLTAWLRHELAAEASLVDLAWPIASDGHTYVESR